MPRKGARCSRRDFVKQAAAFSISAPTALLALGCRSGNLVPRQPIEHRATSPLAEYDALGLAELIRTRQITPSELVEEVSRNMETINPRINAVLPGLFNGQGSRDRARRARGEGRLFGVPVMLKNLIAYRGATIDFGSRLYARAHHAKVVPASEDSALVGSMERAGMIVAGITNSAELGLLDTTEPVLHGATRNPWNPAFTAGGSSGGSAAAVAARIVPLAHGNDGAGSIRIPASHCGVFGLKPSRGRESGSGSATAALSISSDLCLSRSVRDTAAFLSEVESHDAPDLPPVGFVRGPSARRLRIALMMEPFQGGPAHSEVDQAVRSAAALCHELGHRIEEVPLPIAGQEFMDAFIGLWATTTLRLEQLVVDWLGNGTQPEEVLEAWTLGLISMAKARGREVCILRALDAFAKASAQMEAFFRDHDVMLSPVLRVAPFPLGWHDPSGNFGTIMERFLDAVGYTPLQNATGMPGMSVPLHWTADGLPVGVQFSAWRGAEVTLLELAYELEQARPWAHRTPQVAVR